MAKRGPPKTVIDWQIVDAMCKIQCTGTEIASVLDMDYKTLERACKKEHNQKFGEYSAQKREGGKASLRRNQWKLMESGNAVMNVWLGKQYLGQTDKVEPGSDEAMPVKIEVDVINAAKPKLSTS